MRVLIVEDDPAIAEGLAVLLRAHGYGCDVCATLACADAALAVEAFDLVLLDRGLPDGDALPWLQARRARDWGVPVLILTARDALPDRVAGLDQGADDYLVKPIAPEELLARMRVALRRSEGRADPLLRHGDLVVDPAARRVWRGGQPVPLRAREFAVLMVLLRARGRVVTRQRLQEALYGFDEAVESNALEVHVHHLRRKLGDGLIQTMRGVGYSIPVVPEAAPGAAPEPFPGSAP
ncbi:winged helix-turn-helix domain-containing protein [Tepidimonas taiwanensis]|uniref:Transcriptional regulatory protein BasR n=1 Tax=Tepidimonas taiwanensis TaxID=307486 RepID=A0A554WYZ3_9BURK|nr:winged helix-turn-helix domain-containing protein [Tepidimonas taiwanensis]MCX7692185.1 winged helix-turn-helix domain-containing protein [Tepidimonas taiwanensis]TSE28797.1 Transcriptional regulatory protein BasR [Tepidimonas taiwanensis]UBQ06191.1 winged helix-turn-helix domain-containing protein [Tepidimonas taiwanensis]